MAIAFSWIAERIRRTVPALEPDLMRPQLPKIHKKVWIKGHATSRVGIHPHHPATHVRVELVIPTTVERVGKVNTPSIAAHLDHLWSSLDGTAFRMWCGIDQATDAYGACESRVQGVGDVILA